MVDGLDSPQDAEPLPNNNVLITERGSPNSDTGRVIEIQDDNRTIIEWGKPALENPRDAELTPPEPTPPPAQEPGERPRIIQIIRPKEAPTPPPTATPTPTPSVTPSPTPTVTPTATPSSTPSPTPMVTATAPSQLASLVVGDVGDTIVVNVSLRDVREFGRGEMTLTSGVDTGLVRLTVSGVWVVMLLSRG